MSLVTVLVADDHGVVRAGLKTLLERSSDIQVIGEACDGREAVKLAEELNPQVVVMDITMPHLNGIDATAQIVRRNHQISVIILSMYSDEAFLLRGLNAGIRGYLLKDSAELDLERAVRAVAQGKCFFSPVIAQMLAEDYTRALQQKSLEDTYDLLTEREREILQMLAEGKTNKEVATTLNVSTYTVDTHRAHIMEKLGLHNTAELVLYAVRKKIIT